MGRKMQAKELWALESYLEYHLSVIAATTNSQALLDIGRGNLIKTAAMENNLGSSFEQA